MVRSIITEENSNAFVEAMLEEKIQLDHLEAYKIKQIGNSDDGYKAITGQWLRMFLEADKNFPTILTDTRHTVGDFVKLYSQGELIALGFLSGGDFTKDIITRVDLEKVIAKHISIQENDSSKFIMSRMEMLGFGEDQFVNYFGHHVHLAPTLGGLYTMKDKVFRAGYASIIGAVNSRE